MAIGQLKNVLRVRSQANPPFPTSLIAGTQKAASSCCLIVTPKPHESV